MLVKPSLILLVLIVAAAAAASNLFDGDTTLTEEEKLVGISLLVKYAIAYNSVHGQSNKFNFH